MFNPSSTATSRFFKDVRKVQPGHYLLCYSGRSPREVMYWDSSYPDKHTPELRTEQEKGINPDLNFIGVYALSELFREHGFIVNINGQGADEIRGGYNIFLPDFLRESDQAFQSPNAAAISTGEQVHQLNEAEGRLNEIFGGKLQLSSELASSTRNTFNNILTPELMSLAYPPLPLHPAFTPSRPVDIEAAHLSHLSSIVKSAIKDRWHPFHAAQYVFVHAHLQNLLLSHLGDRCEMSHSIEGRTPFLDNHLTEYTNNVPPSMKIRYDPKKKQWIEKYILLEAGKRYITQEVYEKKIHPYSAPMQYPVDGPLHRLLRKLVTKESVDELGWLVGDGVEDRVRMAFEERDKASFKLVICLAQWVVIAQRFRVKKAVKVQR